jgi:hypothetical protein
MEALRLPQGARAALAGELIVSLDRKVDKDANASWSREVAERVVALDSGKVGTIPWAQVRRKILGVRRGPPRA